MKNTSRPTSGLQRDQKPATERVRLLDYLPDYPRFDDLRQIFSANELKRAEQMELLPSQESERAATNVSRSTTAQMRPRHQYLALVANCPYPPSQKREREVWLREIRLQGGEGEASE